VPGPRPCLRRASLPAISAFPSRPALPLLVFSPTAVAHWQRRPITDANIKSAVGPWTTVTSPTTATTTARGNIGDWNVAAVANLNMDGLFYAEPTRFRR
jgi:hypothetical protein